MANPFAFIANATITLSLPGQTLVTDPETGNISAVTATASYRVFTKIDRDANIEYEVGADTSATIYIGYLADSDPLKQAWPSSTTVGTIASLLMDGDAEPYEARFTMVNGLYGLAGIGAILPPSVRSKFQLTATRRI